MLGRLKMSVEDCITAYMSLAHEVFEQQRRMFTIRGGIQGRFDAKTLEEAVKRILEQQGLHKETLLKDDPDADCKMYVLDCYLLFYQANPSLTASCALRVRKPLKLYA
jgi:hypothetical protein